MALTIAVIFILSYCIKQVIYHPRPNGLGNGMPSGHAAAAAGLLPFIGITPLSIILIIAIGAERVITHQHTVLQVLVGYLFGYIISYISIKLWKLE